MTVIDCPNITGAKAPVAPVLNTPLPMHNQSLTQNLKKKNNNWPDQTTQIVSAHYEDPLNSFELVTDFPPTKESPF